MNKFKEGDFVVVKPSSSKSNYLKEELGIDKAIRGIVISTSKPQSGSKFNIPKVVEIEVTNFYSERDGAHIKMQKLSFLEDDLQYDRDNRLDKILK